MNAPLAGGTRVPTLLSPVSLKAPQRALVVALRALGLRVGLIGGARDAGRLDAQRAMEEGYRLRLEC